MDLLIDQQATIRELAEIAEVSKPCCAAWSPQGCSKRCRRCRPAYPPPIRAMPCRTCPTRRGRRRAPRRGGQGAAFQPFLLDGVTGSGKTETYSEAIAAAIEQGGRCWSCCPKSP
jgi:primosomal protein N' (replication factor Y)